jgi:hypothetical protein
VTPEERKELRALLKNTGEEGFIAEVINKRGMAIRKVLTAFNVRPVCYPPFSAILGMPYPHMVGRNRFLVAQTQSLFPACALLKWLLTFSCGSPPGWMIVRTDSCSACCR